MIICSAKKNKNNEIRSVHDYQSAERKQLAANKQRHTPKGKTNANIENEGEEREREAVLGVCVCVRMECTLENDVIRCSQRVE